MRASALSILVLAISLTGCSKVVKADGAEKAITDLVTRQTQFHPKDVKCPSGVSAKAGKDFDCHFTGPDGKYVAHMHIQKVSGSKVYYSIRTERTS